MSGKTIDAYSRAVRRVAVWFDCCPDRLEAGQLAEYFSELVESHSWSTVKLDRCGLQFFYQHVLKRDWQWVEMIRAPRVRSLPDILSVAEVERLTGPATRQIAAGRLFHGHLHLARTTARAGLAASECLWPDLRLRALATVFRARLLDGLNRARLRIPDNTPKRRVVDCRRVGRGKPALEYLSRYLYRGVIAERDILTCRNGKVTFRYAESRTGATRARTLEGADFLWLILQHVLSRGFRRVRDYGFLHGNAKSCSDWCS